MILYRELCSHVNNILWLASERTDILYLNVPFYFQAADHSTSKLLTLPLVPDHSILAPEAMQKRVENRASVFSSNSGNWFRAVRSQCPQPIRAALYELVCMIKKKGSGATATPANRHSIGAIRVIHSDATSCREHDEAKSRPSANRIIRKMYRRPLSGPYYFYR